MSLQALTAISPLDGRYENQLIPLKNYFSEYALIKARVTVEIRWLEQLAACETIPEIAKLSKTASAFFQTIITQFSIDDAAHIKAIERTTNHDVKAVEYFLKEKMMGVEELAPLLEFIHFACTSEDINNLAYGLMLKEFRENELIPSWQRLINQLRQLAQQFADTAMLSRTHGQTATPTTLGKEFANVVARLDRQLKQMHGVDIFGKMNGAVGNFNAHLVSYPEVNWLRLSEQFVESLGLTWQPYSTQIECHDYLAELSHVMMRFNTINLDLARDLWSYISLGYFKQKIKEGEVGSSTMPHKVNPIDFENAEGNIGLANCLFDHFANKLPISRWQRDLSDSTVLRNLGSAYAYSALAYQSLERGLNKLALSEECIESDLMSHWEVLTEAIQTVMRRYGLPEPYEQLKALSRGKPLNQAILHEFISQLALPSDVLAQLMQLTPKDYTGLANTLAKRV